MLLEEVDEDSRRSRRVCLKDSARLDYDIRDLFEIDWR